MKKRKTTLNFVENTDHIIKSENENILIELISIANCLSDKDVKELIHFAQSFPLKI